jgi:hypothetical protein
MPRKKSNQKNSKKPQNKKQWNKARKRYYKSSSQMIISKPLLPETQKVCLKYYTRFHINPVAVRSGANQTANNVAQHTFSWNDPYDIDKTHGLPVTAGGVTTGRLQDGAPDHQPRMYDEYGNFYNKITVIGAKASMTFSQSSRAYTSNTDHNSDGSTTTVLRETDQLPTFVGFANKSYNDKPLLQARWDDLREKNEVIFRRLMDRDKPIKMTAKWSINKENVFKNKLPMGESSEAPENFTANWNHSPTNLRFLHLFAHPITVTNASDPARIVTGKHSLYLYSI